MDTTETTIYIAVLITGIVIGTLLVYFAVIIFRSQRKQFRQYSHQLKKEIELLEGERKRIANDLHDELGPLLTVTSLHLSQVEDELDKENESIRKAYKNIDLLNDRLGGIARNLIPRTLAKKGLKTALSDFVEELESSKELMIEFIFKVKKEPGQDLSLHIYRIVQELLHNAAKHSEATRVELKIIEKGKSLFIYCKDNGKGFDEEKELEKGQGLSSLRNRAQLLGGKMSCDSMPGKGTEYFFEVPSDQKNESEVQDTYSGRLPNFS